MYKQPVVPTSLAGLPQLAKGGVRPKRVRTDDRKPLSIHRLMRKMRAKYRHRELFFFPDAVIEDLHEKFCLFDHDGDRTINKSEVNLCVRCLGIRSWSDADLRRRIAFVDDNDDGCVTFNEFIELLLLWRQEQLDREARIHELFARFDRDGDDAITIGDVIDVLCPRGADGEEEGGGAAGGSVRRAAIEQLFASTDADNDNSISLAEFKRLYISEDEPSVTIDGWRMSAPLSRREASDGGRRRSTSGAGGSRAQPSSSSSPPLAPAASPDALQKYALPRRMLSSAILG